MLLKAMAEINYNDIAVIFQPEYIKLYPVTMSFNAERE